MSIHNTCFHGEIRQIFIWLPLSRAMYNSVISFGSVCGEPNIFPQVNSGVCCLQSGLIFFMVMLTVATLAGSHCCHLSHMKKCTFGHVC